MKRRVLSLLLAVALVRSNVPLPVLAAEAANGRPRLCNKTAKKAVTDFGGCLLNLSRNYKFQFGGESPLTMRHEPSPSSNAS